MDQPVETLDEHNIPVSPQQDDPAHPVQADERILGEQVRQLFTLGKPGSYSIFVALIVVWLPFTPYVDAWTIAPPFLILVCSQLSFNRLRAAFLKDNYSEFGAEIWANRYARRTLLSGSAWGLAAFLWFPDTPFVTQALFCLVLAALCLQAILSRHVYLPALIYYSAASVSPTLLTLLAVGTFEGRVMAGLGFVLWVTMYHAARSLNRASGSSVALGIQNADLLTALEVARQGAEQKARDVEHAYATARKAEHSRRDFIAMVTHEIRAPLASLQGLGQLLAKVCTTEIQQTYANAVQESGDFLNRLVDDLADLTEMETLSIRLRPTDICPVEIAKHTVSLMRHEAAKKRLSIEMDVLPGTPATIYNDADRVKQTLVNLISRAIRTTETGGVVIRVAPVYVGSAQPGVRFSVADTGAGMPTEDAARLFSALEEEEDRNPKRRKDVNLTISERLVRLMCGRIGADSSVGSGFTAWFTLGCHAIERRAELQSDQQIVSSGQILDFDRVYELEQDLGTGRIADHLNEAINSIADMQLKLAEACRKGDIDAIHSTTDLLTTRATQIGLTGFCEAAQAFQSELDHPLPAAQLVSRSIEMDAKLQAGIRALTRAYPSITN